VLAGYNPYVQNVADHGHPFHPIMGAEGFDKDSTHWPANNWPVNFEGTTSLERLFLSLFSRAADESIIEPEGDSAVLKVPFTVSVSEIRPYMGSDTRIAGFGPLFSGALVLAAVTLGLLIIGSRRPPPNTLRATVLLVVLLAVTVAVNPESWWARFAPQIWLVPVVIAGAALSQPSRSVAAVLGCAVAITLLMNVVFVTSVNFANHVNGTQEITAALDEIKGWDGVAGLVLGDFAVDWMKFDEQGIPWRIIEEGEAPAETGLTIPYTTTTAYPQ
jgi:hypothetical protein